MSLMRPSLKRNAELGSKLVKSLLLAREQQEAQKRIGKSSLFKSTCLGDIQLAAAVWALRLYIITSVSGETRSRRMWEAVSSQEKLLCLFNIRRRKISCLEFLSCIK